MELHGNEYVYEVIPAVYGQQSLQLTASSAALDSARQEYPDASPEAITTLARERAMTSDVIWFGLKAIGQRSIEELEQYSAAAYSDYARDKAGELIKGKAFEQLKRHVVSINNVVVDGTPITTLEELRDTDSCKDLYQWLCGACSSIVKLTAAERKNFLPG